MDKSSICLAGGVFGHAVAIGDCKMLRILICMQRLQTGYVRRNGVQHLDIPASHQTIIVELSCGLCVDQNGNAGEGVSKVR
ncbi:hypothetical protein AQ709_26710 [Burkholderia pseudomallei]|nr:hypothetical protein AQ709_26710 [Burkholderia pseudomallei]OMQ65159.1 hypothetical protein AQ712_13120 [Burkholderia pseudomallei]OMQ72890.1 hypothetical protein AQ711_02580 [Burkholderia pseudomallei]